jgi:hypothetical protein
VTAEARIVCEMNLAYRKTTRQTGRN